MRILSHLFSFRSRLLNCPASIRRLTCVAYLGLIAVMSLLPSFLFPVSPPPTPGLDKLAHILMYGGLVSLLRWAAAGVRSPAWNPADGGTTWPWIIGGAFGYGLLMEILQALCTGGQRTFAWGDVAANGVGAVVFWFVAGRILIAAGRADADTSE